VAAHQTFSAELCISIHWLRFLGDGDGTRIRPAGLRIVQFGLQERRLDIRSDHVHQERGRVVAFVLSAFFTEHRPHVSDRQKLGRQTLVGRVEPPRGSKPPSTVLQQCLLLVQSVCQVRVVL
jgi:hypothetical protein